MLCKHVTSTAQAVPVNPGTCPVKFDRRNLRGSGPNKVKQQKKLRNDSEGHFQTWCKHHWSPFTDGPRWRFLPPRNKHKTGFCSKHPKHPQSPLTGLFAVLDNENNVFLCYNYINHCSWVALPPVKSCPAFQIHASTRNERFWCGKRHWAFPLAVQHHARHFKTRNLNLPRNKWGLWPNKEYFFWRGFGLWCTWRAWNINADHIKEFWKSNDQPLKFCTEIVSRKNTKESGKLCEDTGQAHLVRSFPAAKVGLKEPWQEPALNTTCRMPLELPAQLSAPGTVARNWKDGTRGRCFGVVRETGRQCGGIAFCWFSVGPDTAGLTDVPPSLTFVPQTFLSKARHSARKRRTKCLINEPFFN